MSENVKINLTRIALILSILGAVAVFGRTYASLPDKIESLQKRVVSLEESQHRINEQLAEIKIYAARTDENVKFLTRSR